MTMPDPKDSDITTQTAELLPSSIELQKNSRGYTWTIKLRCTDGGEDALIDRIKSLNTRMKTEFDPEG